MADNSSIVIGLLIATVAVLVYMAWPVADQSAETPVEVSSTIVTPVVYDYDYYRYPYYAYSGPYGYQLYHRPRSLPGPPLPRHPGGPHHVPTGPPRGGGGYHGGGPRHH